MSPRQLACGLAGVALFLVRSPPAHSCSCPADSAHIEWPRQGATGVELDAAVVVATTGLQRVDAALTAGDGSRVPLVVRHRLDAESSGCVNSDFWFLTPATPLSSHTQYTLHVQSPDASSQGFISIAARDVAFTTGDSLRAAAFPEVQLSVYGVESPSGRLLELFMASDWPEPLFVEGRGGSRPQTRAWAPSHAPEPYSLSLGAAECAEAVVLDVTGRVVLSEARCAPSKCARTSLLRGGICGGELGAGLTWADWQELPDGCGDEPGDEPIDVVSSEEPSAAGCQVAGAHGQNAALAAALPSLAALSLAALSLLARLRRRTRRSPSAR